MDGTTMELEHQLQSSAQLVVDTLRKAERRLVLSESCTGGMIASTLTGVAGVSEVFCGSAVTYRNETKAQWLHVSRAVLADPRQGAVSPLVAEQMCRGALEQTPEACLTASITGHLGPDAPPHLDGLVFIGVLSRNAKTPTVQRRMLSSKTQTDLSLRERRRCEATLLVLQAILKELAGSTGSS